MYPRTPTSLSLFVTVHSYICTNTNEMYSGAHVIYEIIADYGKRDSATEQFSLYLYFHPRLPRILPSFPLLVSRSLYSILYAKINSSIFV